MPQRPRDSMPTAPPQDVPTENPEGAEDEGEGEISSFCQTDIDSMPADEFSLYKRVSTVLNKAGIETPEQLQAMKYAQRRRIRGLGANGLELIQETLDTGEDDRISMLFQEPGKRGTSAKYGPSPFKGVPAHIADRLKKNDVTSLDQLVEMSDEELKGIKGLGASAIAKIRETYTPPALSDEELDAIESRPGKVKITTVKALIAEVRAARRNAASTTNGYVEAGEAEEYSDEGEGTLVGAAAE